MFKARMAHAPYFYLIIKVREVVCVCVCMCEHSCKEGPTHHPTVQQLVHTAAPTCAACAPRREQPPAPTQPHSTTRPHPQDDAERDVEAWLRRKYEGRIREAEVVLREDLDLVRACVHACVQSCVHTCMCADGAWCSLSFSALRGVGSCCAHQPLPCVHTLPPLFRRRRRTTCLA
jgi:hypothetical protein